MQDHLDQIRLRVKAQLAERGVWGKLRVRCAPRSVPLRPTAAPFDCHPDTL